MTKPRSKKSTGARNSLDKWVLAVEIAVDHRLGYDLRILNPHKEAMAVVPATLKAGDFDIRLSRDRSFFRQTEALVLDIYQRREISIKDPEIYDIKEDVIQALQMIYMYAVDHFDEYDIHPALLKTRR